MNRHPKIARALRAARKPYADGGDITTADIRRGLRDTVTNRAMLLPLADYADGSTRLAWPGIIHEPAAAWKRMVDEGPTAEDSFTVASAVPIAGLAAAAVRPGVSLGSGGGKLPRSLPMDEASRMSRARELGYDTDRVWYHATAKGNAEKIDQFIGNSNGLVYFSDNPQAASIGAMATAPHDYIPVFIRSSSPVNTPDNPMHWMEAQGYRPVDRNKNVLEALGRDLVYIEDEASGKGTTIAVLPNAIRRIDAAFDPQQASSSNILAANRGAVPLIPHAQDDDQRRKTSQSVVRSPDRR